MIKFFGLLFLLFAAPLPEIVELQIPGHVTIWRDEMAPSFFPTRENVQSYLQELSLARSNSGRLNHSSQFQISNYFLTRHKGSVALKVSGSFLRQKQKVYFAELQIFKPKRYRQYTFTSESNERFDEAQAFGVIETVADRDL